MQGVLHAVGYIMASTGQIDSTDCIINSVSKEGTLGMNSFWRLISPDHMGRPHQKREGKDDSQKIQIWEMYM